MKSRRIPSNIVKESLKVKIAVICEGDEEKNILKN